VLGGNERIRIYKEEAPELTTIQALLADVEEKA
jgi:hypothetical protein